MKRNKPYNNWQNSSREACAGLSLEDGPHLTHTLHIIMKYVQAAAELAMMLRCEMRATPLYGSGPPDRDLVCPADWLLPPDVERTWGGRRGSMARATAAN